jgi:type I restriction enzyme S subunit
MITPKLRFASFKKSWKSSKLELAIASIQSGKSKDREINGQFPLFGSTGVIGYTNKPEYSGKSILIARVGANAGSKYVVDGEYSVTDNTLILRLKEGCSYQFFSDLLEHKKLNKLTFGSGQPLVTGGLLKQLEVNYPEENEQQKVASFLSKIDQKISLLTKKHELFAQYKKGVMQKIFNREIRFKDRAEENFPEWEYFSGDEIFKSVNNRNHNSELPILSATQDRGMYPRSENGIDIISSEKSVSSYKVINKGDYVISLRSFQGGIEYSEYDGISSPAYTVLKPIKEISDNFFRAYFKKDSFISQLNSTVVGIRDGKQISFSAFSTLELPYPCIKEQELIANFLSLIDKKIALCNAELMATKQYKQGLLQQMFI